MLRLPVEEGRFVSLDIVCGKPHATVIVDRKWWEFWRPKAYTKMFPVADRLEPTMAEVVDFALAKRRHAAEAAVAKMHPASAMHKSPRSSP